MLSKLLRKDGSQENDEYLPQHCWCHPTNQQYLAMTLCNIVTQEEKSNGEIPNNYDPKDLPTLVIVLLKQLLKPNPQSKDEEILKQDDENKMILYVMLSCLGIFTQQPCTSQFLLLNPLKSQPQSGNTHTDEKQLYWAKGTGFSMGSMNQTWSVDQTVSDQNCKEQHLIVLLQTLSVYIKSASLVTSDVLKEDSDKLQLPYNLLPESCLLPVISSFLKNDSVLDIARHMPLYRSVMQLLRVLAEDSRLVLLLVPHKSSVAIQPDHEPILTLLTKMKTVVETYASRLKSAQSSRINLPNTQGSQQSRSSCWNIYPHTKHIKKGLLKHQEEDKSDEDLALLISDIQDVTKLLESTDVTDELANNDVGCPKLELPLEKSLEKRYLQVMKPLQFKTYEMITESSDGKGFQFKVPFHFEPIISPSGDHSHPARVRRLAQEMASLSTSLPLSFSSSVFVCCDADRMDVMKVLITGPAETPYANGCFELDVYFPLEYPISPMLMNLNTTGNHTVSFNPNFYSDGKVCLSILNTWLGRPEENWNAKISSLLQVLVSIQSLIMVPDPIFNEPGAEAMRGTEFGNTFSFTYNTFVKWANIKWAMLEQLRNPSQCFKQVIQTHFWIKREEIKSQIGTWLTEMESQSPFNMAVATNLIATKFEYDQLCNEFAKLKPPPGLED